MAFGDTIRTGKTSAFLYLLHNHSTYRRLLLARLRFTRRMPQPLLCQQPFCTNQIILSSRSNPSSQQPFHNVPQHDSSTQEFEPASSQPFAPNYASSYAQAGKPVFTKQPNEKLFEYDKYAFTLWKHMEMEIVCFHLTLFNNSIPFT